MRISIFAQHLRSHIVRDGYVKTPEEGLAFGARAGITAAEVFTDEFDATTTPKAYKQELNRVGIQLAGLIVTTKFICRDDEAYQKGLAELKHWVDVAAEIQAESVMVVPFCDWVWSDADKAFARERLITAMRELVSYAEPTNVKICMENFSLYAYPYSLVEDILAVFEQVPGLHYIMDAANLYCVRGDIFKLYEGIKHRIVKIHAKDWKEDCYGSIIRPMLPQLEGCAVGSGVVPNTELMKRLKADGFDGDAIIEINANVVSADDIAESAAFLKQELG